MLKPFLEFDQPIVAFASEDALSQVLNSMRISGSLLLKEKYKSPWAVSVPSSDTLNTLFQTAGDMRIAAFHLVERGHINVKLDDGENVLVEAGEMIVCFSGKRHRLYQGREQKTVPFQEIMAGSPNAFQPKAGDQSACTSLVCGVFFLSDTLLNPLLAALPSILKFNVTSPNEQPRLYGVVSLLMQEFQRQNVGNNYVVQRYLEILCTEAVRAYVDNLPENATGWLAALKDPMIGRAIELIHAKPNYSWSVKNLASAVDISPSRFAARFRSTLGEPPMAYIAKWRMSIASQLLRDNQQSISQIAHQVGYESLAAFSRAFKRYVGLPPATWRMQFS